MKAGVLLLLLLIATEIRAAEPVVVAGPDGRIAFRLVIDQGRARWGVSMGETPVIEPSRLVLTIDDRELTDPSKAGSVETYSGEQTYPTRGAHATATDRHHGARISLGPCILEVRAFDDGVAYRFIVPGQSGQQRVPDERSGFILPAGSTLWYHGLRGHYEGDYVKRDVGEVPAGEWAAPPLTAKLPGGAGYVSISEANLVKYSGMALEADGKNGFVIGLAHRQPVSYPYELRYPPEDVERLKQPAKVQGTITTPWRVVIVAKDLNALVNSDIIANLSPPPDPKLFPDGVNSAWVKPGRAVWKYLDNPDRSAPADPLATKGSAKPQAATTSANQQRRRTPTTPEDMKTFSRLASELGLEYNVLEGFWRRWSDDEIRDVVSYSRQRGVGLFVWVHSRDLRTPRERAALFKRCRDTGIAGLKIDFFDHEHKETIDQYHAILREAAANKLLLDFHGANKPAGEARSWPNELVREAVRGMEASRLHERASHNTTLPFTRYVVGHAEYTPVVFGPRRGDTSWAHQVATAGVFTAPLLTYGGHPENLLNSSAAEMIKSIPSTWDQTIVLPPSEIGELAVFARRKGGTWFLAVLNGPNARRFEVPLSFLGDASYQSLVIRDVPNNPAAMDVGTLSARRDGSLAVDLIGGGGMIARFTSETTNVGEAGR